MFGLSWGHEKPRTLARTENPFMLMRRDLDTLFDRFFGRWGFPPEETWVTPEMGLDVEDKEKEFLIRAEVPGFAANEVEVELSGDVLTITARHEEKEEKKEKEVPEKPARFSHLTKSVVLPAAVDAEKIEAAYKNGVLEIHVPKAPEAMARKIPIKA
jgi:HSP20 family protein